MQRGRLYRLSCVWGACDCAWACLRISRGTGSGLNSMEALTSRTQLERLSSCVCVECVAATLCWAGMLQGLECACSAWGNAPSLMAHGPGHST